MRIVDKCVLLLMKCGFAMGELDTEQGQKYVTLAEMFMLKLQKLL